MKTYLLCALMIAGAGLTRATIIESISIDLSGLHAGSTLSGTFLLSDAPMAGDSTTALLTFSDPSDYSPTSLTATIELGSGVPSGETVRFDTLTFTNLTNTTPNTVNINLMVHGAAQCASFPCNANGRFEDDDPAVFSGMYSIAAVTVPEPTYGLMFPLLLAGFALGRRVLRAA
jgi:hypothetical protein